MNANPDQEISNPDEHFTSSIVPKILGPIDEQPIPAHNETSPLTKNQKQNGPVGIDISLGQNEHAQAKEEIDVNSNQLKTLRAIIWKRTRPTPLKMLLGVSTAFMVSLVILAILIIAFRLNEVSNSNSDSEQPSTRPLVNAYQRTSLIAQINYKLRKLERLARGQITTSDATALEFSIKDELISLIDELTTVQFDLMSSSAETITGQSSVVLQHMLDSGIGTDTRLLTDAIFQYITVASSLRNSTLPSIILASMANPSTKNFFFATKNGLGPLRIASENEAQVLFDYYSSPTSTSTSSGSGNSKQYSLPIMIVALLILVFGSAALVIVTFSIINSLNHSTKLISSTLKSSDPKGDDPLDNLLEEISLVKPDKFKIHPEDVPNKNMKPKEEITRKEKADKAKTTSITRKYEKVYGVLLFLLPTILFALYFILDYSLIGLKQEKVNDQNRATFLKYKPIFERMSSLNFFNALTLEEIAAVGLSTENADAKESYKNLILENEQKIAALTVSDFPEKLGFFNTLQSYQNNGLCASYYAAKGQEAYCQTITGGLLRNDLSLVISTIVSNYDGYQNDFMSKLANGWSTDAAQTATINSIAPYEAATDAIVPAMSELMDQFESENKSNSNANTIDKSVEIGKFVGFIVFSLLVFALWIFYIKNLGKKIAKLRKILGQAPLNNVDNEILV